MSPSQKYRVVFSVIIIAAGGGGVIPAAMAQDEAAEAATAVVRAFVRAIDYADWDGFEEALAEDATMFFPFAPHRADNRREIEAVMRPIFERNRQRGPKPLFGFELRDVQVQRLNGRAVVVTWLMDQPGAVQRRTAVLRNDTGRWRIVSFHGSAMATS